MKKILVIGLLVVVLMCGCACVSEEERTYPWEPGTIGYLLFNDGETITVELLSLEFDKNTYYDDVAYAVSAYNLSSKLKLNSSSIKHIYKNGSEYSYTNLPLDYGDNTFTIFYSPDGQNLRNVKLCIHRHVKYTLRFAAGGQVQEILCEEGSTIGDALSGTIYEEYSDMTGWYYAEVGRHVYIDSTFVPTKDMTFYYEVD